MITSSRLGTNGRLGNQLFQYAALVGLSLYRGYSIRLPGLHEKLWHGQKCLIGQFSIPEEEMQDTSLRIDGYYNEPDHTKFDPSYFSIRDNTDINGFFQSLKYFEHCADEVKKRLKINDRVLIPAIEYVDSLRKGKKIAAIHVRRGDNIFNGDSINFKMFHKDGPYFSYLRKAVKYLEGHDFLIFSGGSRDSDNSEDLKWCRDNLGIAAFYSEGSDTITDMARMLSCDARVMSPLSSFSWWVNFLSQGINIAPIDYFLEGNIRPNFYPKSFVLL